MSANVSPTAANSNPLLRQMKRMVHRLGSIAEGVEDRSALRRGSTSSSATSPNITPSTSLVSPTRQRAPPLNPLGIAAQRNQSLSVETNTEYQSPSLRRWHGRLIVPPEEIDTLPQALPTENFYLRFPRAVGPLANVVVTTPEEYCAVLASCDPVTIVKSPKKRDTRKRVLCREDVAQGGFFVYQPKGKPPQYFQQHDAATDEYGTASYIQS